MTLEDGLAPSVPCEVNIISLKGGNLRHKLNEWEKITTDVQVLEAIKGLQIDFNEIPLEVESIREYSTTSEEASILNDEVHKLLNMGVIELSYPEPGQVVSPIFLREKPDGSHRMILNLKKLNEDVVYKHFKMDTLETILNLVDKGSFMTTIDIKNAYYAVNIHYDFQKYLKFTHKGVMYKFTCLPNGLSPGPRIFTKIMKPVLAALRLQRVILAIYIDDLINLHRNRNRCASNTHKIVALLEKLGFHLNTKKSSLEPSQTVEFLGFVIDSIKMIIQLTTKKKESLVELCKQVLNQQYVTIRVVAKLLGKFTSSFLGVKFGPLHYRFLDNDKTKALVISKGNFNATMCISEKGREDILWWLDNTLSSFNHIGVGNPTIVITTDACLTGWGGTIGSQRTHGLWHNEETQADSDINILELKAILFSLKALLNDSKNVHLKILSDNTTAVHSINNMGTCRSLPCHQVVMDIWEWADAQNNWLTATHIAGKDNTEADALSRIQETSMEWKLNENIFHKIVSKYGLTPEIDLFATRINTQLNTFASFKPDPEATYINSFTLNWGDFQSVYCFPPFAIIGKVVRKIIKDQANALLVTPNWQTQYWYPLLLEITNPYFISPPSSTTMLYLPNDLSMEHPMQNLVLAAWRIYGKCA